MKFIVVGTSHAGYEATETLLQENPDAEVHLYERGSTASFLSCGIQSYLEGISKNADQLHYATEHSFKEQGVIVHMNSDVVGIDAANKTITVKSEDGESEESYDKLFLSPGAKPLELPVPGTDLENAFYVRGRNWAEKIKDRMAESKKAVVVGAGYIGIEVVEAFAKAGIEVTVIDALDRILKTYLDKEFTDILEDEMRDQGITVRTDEMVKEIVEEDGKVKKVITNKGEYEADTVILSAGVRPNTKWLDGIIELDKDGTVVVDEYMETSEKDIFAAGDATKIPFAPTHGGKLIALASNARRQAVVAAKNMSDKKMKMPEVTGTSGLSLFSHKFASTGVKDIDSDTVEAEVTSKFVEEKLRPSFMGDDEKVLMKVHYEKDSHRIVGAQLMSTYDITPAINTLSVVITAGWTLEQLAFADFFFQPEFNRPWNFLNVLAHQALEEPYGSDNMLF
ncbi:NADPH-dependent 2,4-dienoyl-CoA reductase, sulfur reductase [Alkalibacterium putridalgicola]|uniref:CoA-disulfide reductase n=1 Tax=Alkalibacterium putridalgicola TaxID=426703 RepID=A0A1H7STE3_9LACT|nr:FAD-dependent oxidoreductase [Alkalibacterium putridalgicola]GEK89160.1 CoA-disulfide reductase [Alkalibacterium putridalgicola]SEL75204.1 NADPH-dependent 2,4-dienoyl-CoA reductase, sulfur reductase [Alkalibacterium putridalgicola]